MSYQPVIPLGGIAGWMFLNKTKARQSASFANSPEIKRDVTYFRANIGNVKSAKDLVADRKLLKVALGAFGLDSDLNKQFFIRKVLEEGTSNPKAIANRLVDKRYAQLTDAFGFGSSRGQRNGQPGFSEKITAAYEAREFEVAIGKSDNALRLAMSFQRKIAEIARKSGHENTGWYKILGSPPTRKVFEEAFRLPAAFSSLGIDRQIATLKAKVQSAYGSKSMDVFLDQDNVQDILRKFLVVSNLSGQTSKITGQSVALTLLQQNQSANSGTGTIESIFTALY